MIENQDQLISALARRDTEALIGTPESDWLDFKSEPYQLGTTRGIADLIADVASFANARGGVIVIGVHTTQSEKAQQETAAKVRGVKPGLVSEEQIRKIIRAHTAPLVTVAVDRCPVAEREVVTITVKAAAPHDRPVIVDRTPDPSDTGRGHSFGWPTRDGADTHWESVGRVQQLLAVGLRPTAAAPAPAREEPARPDLDEIDDWGDMPRLLVTAQPVSADSSVDDFFGRFADALTQWKPAREGAFGLQLGPSVRKEGSQLVVAGRRTYLAVDRNGAVFAAANGQPDWLGWSLSDRNGVATAWPNVTAMTANPYVVAEYPTEVARLVAELIDPAVGGTTWTYTVGGEHLLAPIRLDLQPDPGGLGRTVDDAEPITDSFERQVPEHPTWQQTAYALVEEIYSSAWGLGRDSVPFATNGAIDQSKMN